LERRDLVAGMVKELKIATTGTAYKLIAL